MKKHYKGKKIIFSTLSALVIFTTGVKITYDIKKQMDTKDGYIYSLITGEKNNMSQSQNESYDSPMLFAAEDGEDPDPGPWDIQGPTITFVTNGNTTYKKEQGTRVIVEDASGVNASSLRYVWTQSEAQPNAGDFTTSFVNNATITKSDGTGNNWYIWVMARDIWGNVSYKRSNAFYLDNTPPTAPTITANVQSDRWTNETANVVVSGSTNLSGIERYEYTLDDGENWTTVTNFFSILTDGIYKIKARAIGETGVEGEESEEYIIKIDKTPPKVEGIEEGKLYNSVIPKITDDTEITAVINKDGTIKQYHVDSENRGDAIQQSGNYILTVTDEAGNQTTVTFRVDCDAPIITLTPNGNTTYKEEQSTRINVTDANNIDEDSLKYIWAKNIDIVLEYMFEDAGTHFKNGDTITKKDGTGNDYVLLVMAKDEIGNVKLFRSNPFYLDNSGPTAPDIISDISDGGVSNKPIELTIGGSESLSGIQKYQYQINGKGGWTDINEGEKITLTAEGEYAIKARAIDNLGKIGEESIEYTVTISIKVPEITFLPNGNEKYAKIQSVQINLSHTKDLNKSSFRYVWSQSKEGLSKSQLTETFDYGSIVTKNTGSGEWYIWAIATDVLGNTTLTRSEAFMLDNEKPTTPTIGGNTQNNRTVGKEAYITLEGSQSLSGILKYKYSIDNKKQWKAIDENEKITFSEDGKYNIYAKAINNLGEESAEIGPYTITVDLTAPKIIGVENGKIYKEANIRVEDNSTVTIVLKKGENKIQYNEGTKIEEDGEYEISATDEVGNQTTIRFTIDRQGPEITFEPNGNSTYSKSQSTKVNVTDISNADNTSLKYIWSQNNTGITQTNFEKSSTEFKMKDMIEKSKVSGEWYLWIMASDKFGNTSIKCSNAFYFDNNIPEAPEITTTVENGEYTTQDIEFKITGGETISGIRKYQYSLNNGISWKDLEVGKSLKIDTTGVYYVVVRAVSNTGIIGKKSVVYSVTIDKDGPQIIFSPNGNNTYQKKQSSLVQVNTVRTLNSLKYLWSTKPQNVTEDDFETPFANKQKIEKNTESGTWYLWILAKDSSGQQTITRSEKFMLDNEIPATPTIIANAENGSVIKDVLEIQISGSDSPSGIQKYQYTLDEGRTWIDIMPEEKARISVEGTYKIKARAVNCVGSTSAETEEYKVVISRKDLEIAFAPRENEVYQSEQSVHVTIKADAQLVNLKYLWSTKEEDVKEEEFVETFENGQIIEKNTGSGTWYLWILAQDSLGNKTIQRSGKFNFDNDKLQVFSAKRERTNYQNITTEVEEQTSNEFYLDNTEETQKSNVSEDAENEVIITETGEDVESETIKSQITKTNINNTEEKDDTIAKIPIPKAGIYSGIAIIISISVVIGIYSLIKFKKIDKII